MKLARVPARLGISAALAHGVLGLAPPAQAHVGALLEGLDVLAAPDATLLSQVAVEASFGLIWAPEDGSSWRWTCHEAITAPKAVITPRYTRSTEGVWLGSVGTLDQTREPGEAVYRSVEGCDWQTVEGLTDQAVSALHFDPTDPSLAYAATASLDPGASNHLFRSTDAGLSWSPTEVGGEEQLLLSVRSAAGEGGATWATSVWYDDGLAWVHRSANGGESWSSHPVEVDASGGAYIDVHVAAVHPDDPDTAWFVRGPYGADDLLLTTDGGQSFEVVHSTEGDIVDGAIDQEGGVWLVVGGTQIWHAADGRSFSQLPGAPEGLGIATAADQVLLAGRMTFDGIAISGSPLDAPDFEPLLEVRSIDGPVSCPAGSRGAEICEPLWSILDKSLSRYDPSDTGPGTPGETEEPGDSGPHTDSETADSAPPHTGPAEETADTAKVPGRCGCATPHPGGLLPSLFVASALGMRRRSPRR